MKVVKVDDLNALLDRYSKRENSIKDGADRASLEAKRTDDVGAVGLTILKSQVRVQLLGQLQRDILYSIENVEIEDPDGPDADPDQGE